MARRLGKWSTVLCSNIRLLCDLQLLILLSTNDPRERERGSTRTSSCKTPTISQAFHMLIKIESSPAMMLGRDSEVLEANSLSEFYRHQNVQSLICCKSVDYRLACHLSEAHSLGLSARLSRLCRHNLSSHSSGRQSPPFILLLALFL
jgi:hypothetical protein